MNEKIDTFGDYIKRERTMRGVTLEEICKSTNISMRYLEAIETNNYDLLPADVFIKGFLRGYSKCIGVNPNEIILAYTEYRGIKPEDHTSKNEIVFVKKQKEKVFIIGGLIALIVLSALIILSNKNRGKTADIATKQEETSVDTEINGTEKIEPTAQKLSETDTKPQDNQKTESTDIEPPQTTAQHIPPTPPPQIQPAAPPAAIGINTSEKLLTLTIYASEDSWIKTKIDGSETVKEALLHEGENVTYKGNSAFIIDIGNIKGTIVNLNGKEINIPKTESNVIKDFKVDMGMISGSSVPETKNVKTPQSSSLPH